MIEIPEIQQRSFPIKQGGVIHEIPVHNLGTKVALEIADAYDELVKLQDKVSGINFSNPDGMAALRHLLRAFMGLFEICIIDFQKWKPLFDNIPLKIEIYEAIFEDMINAMNGKEDPSKKKTIGESSGSALISGSARPATRRRRSQASTGSGA
jgi:hypothetical protein